MPTTSDQKCVTEIRDRPGYGWQVAISLVAVISALGLAILVGIKSDIKTVAKRQDQASKTQNNILTSMAEMKGNRFTSVDWAREGTSLWKAQLEHSNMAHPPRPTQKQIDRNSLASERNKQGIEEIKAAINYISGGRQER